MKTFTDEDIWTGRTATGRIPERTCPYNEIGCLGYSKSCVKEPCRELWISWTPQKQVCFRQRSRNVGST